MSSLYSVENAVFVQWMFYSTVVLVKMLLMTPLTARMREKKKVFANQEDVDEHNDPKLHIVANDPDVERLRRGHRNDLENIPLFVFLALIYVATNPSLEVATWHFRIYACARIIHTVAYQFLRVHKPRGISFLVSSLCSISMAVQICVFCWGKM